MPTLNLKASHNVVKDYYDTLKGITTLHLFHEGAVSPAFAALLRYCGSQYEWTLVEKIPPQAWQSDPVPRRYIVR